MKSVISILLCAVFLFQPLSKLLIMLDYEINKEAITQNFCVNKDKPKMHCNGKCHLKKQLEKDDKKQQSLPTSLKEKSELPFHTSSVTIDLTTTSTSILHHFTYLFFCPPTPTYSIFHPPTVS